MGNDLWLVAATAEPSAYSAEVIDEHLSDLAWVSERALAHEAVIEHVAQAHTAIPLKLFTIFASDARACAHLTPMRRELGALAARLAGRAEWGLRVSFDGRPARAARPARSGRGFLE